MDRAIRTKYLGYTNTLSSRVKASVFAPNVGIRTQATVNWDHGLSEDRNHSEAAKALAIGLGWYGVWVAGGMDASGYVYVRLTGAASQRIPGPALGIEGVDWFRAPYPANDGGR